MAVKEGYRRLTVETPEALVAFLESKGKEEERSLSSQVRLVLKQWYETMTGEEFVE